ncbi:MAG: diguanylate cyclase [Burkholderiaceae bacterium]
MPTANSFSWIILPAALMASGLALVAIRAAHANAPGSIGDWSRAMLLAAIGLTGLNSGLIDAWFVKIAFASPVFAGCAYFLRGVIRLAKGRTEPSMNALARQLGPVTLLIIGVYFALGVTSGRTNDAFFHAASAGYFCAALVAAIAAYRHYLRSAQDRHGAVVTHALAALIFSILIMTAGSLHCLEAAFSRLPAAPVYFWMMGFGALLVSGSLLWLSFGLRQLTSAGRPGRPGVLELSTIEHSEVIAREVRQHFLGPIIKPVVLLTIEIDSFDLLCNKHDPDLVDHLVTQVGRAIRRSCRETDIALRNNTARFQIACIGADQDEGLAVAERIRLQVRRYPITGADGIVVPCSVSIGLSLPFESPASSSQAATQAEQALDKAKTLGGNLTISHRPAGDTFGG